MRRRITIGLVLAVLAALVPAAPAAAAALPGGKANWVVAVGGLNTPDVNSYRNWVRLGYYVFDTDGSVLTNYWNWSMRDQPTRVDSVYANCTGNVPDCYVKTVAGFLGGPMGGFAGTYSYLDGGGLQVRWTHDRDGAPLGTPLVEHWSLTGGLISDRMARMSSPTFHSNPARIPPEGAFSSYSANFGIGYGSNASLASTTRATMSQLRNDGRYNAQRYTGTFVVTDHGAVNRQTTGGSWWFNSGTQTPGSANHDNPWQVCAGGACLAWNQHASACDCGGGASDKDRIRYIAEVGGGRRNTEWYWCQCLAQGAPCYRANSHPRPLLQVIDDSGEFQGWVGVEAFTHVDARTLLPDGDFASGYFGVFDMVSDPLLP